MGLCWAGRDNFNYSLFMYEKGLYWRATGFLRDYTQVTITPNFAILCCLRRRPGRRLPRREDRAFRGTTNSLLHRYTNNPTTTRPYTTTISRQTSNKKDKLQCLCSRSQKGRRQPYKCQVRPSRFCQWEKGTNLRSQPSRQPKTCPTPM